MKTTKNLIALILLLAAFASCEKEKKDNPPIEPLPVEEPLFLTHSIARVTWSGEAIDTIFYTYDAQGRFVEGDGFKMAYNSDGSLKMVTYSKNYTDTLIFHYEGPKKIIKLTKGYRNGSRQFNLVYGSGTKPDSIISPTEGRAKLEYGTDGMVTAIKWYNKNGMLKYDDFYTWKNGNLEKIEGYVTTTYEFDTCKSWQKTLHLPKEFHLASELGFFLYRDDLMQKENNVIVRTQETQYQSFHLEYNIDGYPVSRTAGSYTFELFYEEL